MAGKKMGGDKKKRDRMKLNNPRDNKRGGKRAKKRFSITKPWKYKK